MKKKTLILLITSFIYLCGCNNNDEHYNNEIEIVKNKIRYHLSEIQFKYNVNQYKVSAYYETAQNLNSSIDSLLSSISQKEIKILIDKYQILKKDLTINPLYDSKYIRDFIIPYRLLPLNTRKEVSNKLKNPKQFELNLLNLESELLAYLSSNIESNDFKFNDLSAIIVDSSDNLKVGDEYSANIYLTGCDTTMLPMIITADISVPDSLLMTNKDITSHMLNGPYTVNGGFKIKITKPGNYGFKGVMLVPNINGEIKKVWFKKNFTINE